MSGDIAKPKDTSIAMSPNIASGVGQYRLRLETTMSSLAPLEKSPAMSGDAAKQWGDVRGRLDTSPGMSGDVATVMTF